MYKLKLFAIVIFGIVNHTYAQENILWKFNTGDRIYSSPINDENNIFFGSSDGYLYAVKLP